MKFTRRAVTACFVFLSILSLALPQLTVASAPFAQNLQFRDAGDGVTRLQQFLNAEHFLIAQSGPGSPGNETTTFGLLTYQALTQFQSAHGLPATGFFGPLTRNFIAILAASSTATSSLSSSVATSTAPSVATSTVVASPSPTTTPAFSSPATTTSGRYSGPYIPGVTPLPGYAPGQLIFIGGGAPAPASPPSPTPYVAKAVHFDGNTYISANSLMAIDNGKFSLSFWFKMQDFGPTVFPTVFVVDPVGTYLTSAILFGPGEVPNSALEINMGNKTSGTLGFDNFTVDAPTMTLTGAWHHVLYSSITNVGGVLGAYKLYIDDVDATPTLFVGDGFVTQSNEVVYKGDDPTTIATVNALNFFIGGDSFGDNFEGDFADMWFAPGVDLFSGGLDIPLATRRKFISASGKPVDLGSDGSAPTGSPPAIFLSGDASEFATNKGIGGAFTVTGTLTDASTSPSN